MPVPSRLPADVLQLLCPHTSRQLLQRMNFSGLTNTTSSQGIVTKTVIY